MEIDAFRLRHMILCLDAETGNPGLVSEILVELEISDARDIARQSVEGLKEPQFLLAACSTLNDPVFAARSGLQIKDGTTLTSYIAKHSKTLRTAIENSSRYYAIFDPAFQYSLRVSGNAASFTLECLDPEFFHLHRQSEFLLFAALARARFLTGSQFYPVEMRFAHPAPASVKKYEKVARCAVVFDAELTEMILPLAVLDLRIPTFDAGLRNHLMLYGDRLLEERPKGRHQLTRQVKSILAKGLPGHIATADEIASGLGMSRRTFARRLGEEGFSFRGVLDDMRCELAKVYLSDTLNIAEIAFYLGYSDQAAFSTAFKRWTGYSPGTWRDAHSPSP